MVVELPIEKKNKVTELIKKINRIKKCKIRKLAVFIGTPESIEVLKCGRVHMRRFERERFLLLFVTKIITLHGYHI